MVRYTVELARALRDRDDVDLSVLAAPPAVPFFQDMLGRPQHVLSMPGGPVPVRTVLERLGLPRRSFHRFDVVHGTKHVLPRGVGRTRVLTVHDMVPQDRPQDFGFLKRNLLTRPYFASIREADVLVCVSRATRTRLHQYVPDVSGRTVVVPLAMSTDLRSAAPAPVESLQGRPFALVVGDPSPRKNLGFVIDLWPRVVGERPDAVLAVVGPPSWGPTEMGAAHESLVAQGSVLMLGHLADAQLRWCYEQSTVVLCPSKLEGFGLPAIEAQAFGAPLITSLDPALCEVSGDAAQHLPDDDADGWARAILEVFSRGRQGAPLPHIRGWDEVAAETVAAVTAARSGRTGPAAA
jgi:glycosyltransferase involved in cell wall biosynthesis